MSGALESAAQTPVNKVGPERAIEDAIMKHPEALGFPGASGIRRCRIGPPSGIVDVVLLPKSGPIELVLVEAKARTAPDAASKVLGQLLMYYAGALTFGSAGVKVLRQFAEDHAEEARGCKKISPKRLTGGLTPAAAAWEVLGRGKRLSSERIHLYVAFDEAPHPAFLDVVGVMKKYHNLNVGYCVVRNGVIEHVTSAGAR
jgi:hypothetical protein